MGASKPTDVRIRAYNVGFGDCFLLSFRYDTGSRHVLIDFGSTALPKRGGPRDLTSVARQIQEDCNGKLAMVVASHRHADHISGFAGPSGELIAGLNPELVVQPWTEDPSIKPDATELPPSSQPRRRAVATLESMHVVAEYLAHSAARFAANKVANKGTVAQLGFLGQTNIQNREAVISLQQMGRRHAYVSYGTTISTGRVLPGVVIEVLGPPTVTQSAAIKHQAASDPDEFWHLAAATSRSMIVSSSPLFPRAPQVRRAVPQEARWLIPRLDQMNAEEQLAIVRMLDSAMNNTSTILLFEVNGTRLLFPGDAQIESWRYALQDAPDAPRVRKLLAGTDVYKVGHHGSLNATPKNLLWANFTKKSSTESGSRLTTVLSTMSGKHGSSDRSTEVPRRTLLNELSKWSTLHNTQEHTTARQFWRDVEVRFSPRPAAS